jgi:hypothetical protein
MPQQHVSAFVSISNAEHGMLNQHVRHAVVTLFNCRTLQQITLAQSGDQRQRCPM